MRTLHWHTEENPCELCGEPVTPESWAGGETWNGGIVAIDDRWETVEQGLYPKWEVSRWFIPEGSRELWWSICRPNVSSSFAATTPIFPPAGWAGKTDAELWAEIVGPTIRTAEIGETVRVGLNGLIFANIRDEDGNHDSVEAPALILALQNAQVLAARLKHG